jgi:hypothetical protein
LTPDRVYSADMFTRPRRTRAARLAFGVLCAALATALASGLALQGKRYFFCDAMGVTSSDPCSARIAAERDVAVHPTDCCVVERVPAVPTSVLATATSVPAASVVAVVAPSIAVLPERPSAAQSEQRATGPPRPPPERVHARVMVFLT